MSRTSAPAGLPPIPPDPERLARGKVAAAEFRERFGPAPPLDVLLTPEQIAAADAALAAKRAAGPLAATLAAIRQARAAAGLTLAEAAARAGVAEETLCRLEGGKVANPGWQTLERCAAAVGLRLTLTAGAASA